MRRTASPQGSGLSSGPEPAHPAGGTSAATTEVAAEVGRLLGEMTLAEKIGQMTQVEKGSITPAEVADHGIGSVLSGGGANPPVNDPHQWANMVGSFVDGATSSRLGVPLLYGVDAVHGHSNVRGATIFPHNIGLGAAGDVDLVRRIGRATALEMAATGTRWTFAPTVAVPRDIRWGRTYEGYGRDPELVATLGAGLVEGLRDRADGHTPVLACLKHFVGDGGTQWGSVEAPEWVDWWDGWKPQWRIDQGDCVVPESTLRSVDLHPYAAGVAAGAETVMASYSSWNGDKLHAHAYLLTEVLKSEMAFEGFVVTDWMAIDQLDRNFETAVVTAINAGIDMVMVPFDFRRFIDTMTQAVAAGRISESRIDDAVRRIMAAKLSLGLGQDRTAHPPLSIVGSTSHRALAAEAARRSAVLLANDGTLPLDAGGGTILLAGRAADDIGLQCGGWTIEWQGAAGPITEGTTLRGALERSAARVSYSADGRFSDEAAASVGIVCVAEDPYAEGLGDRAIPTVRDEDRVVFDRMRAKCDRVVLVVYSGRPLVIPELLSAADAVVAAWLPGTEATELPRLLLGASDFEGRLTQPWPQDRGDLGAPAGSSHRYPVGHPHAIAPAG